MSPRSYLAILATLVGVATGPALGQFTPGQIVVLRAGDGLGALPTGATAVFLDQYNSTTAGQASPSLTVAIPVPVSTNNGNGLTVGGTATTEGQITRSADGQFLERVI